MNNNTTIYGSDVIGEKVYYSQAVTIYGIPVNFK